jgi:dehydrogenase/reductase SDR family member 4
MENESSNNSVDKFIPKRYKNKICLVTGSTMGIGYAIAERFGLEGATLILCSRKPENLKSAESMLKSKGINYVSLICNFNSKDDRDKLFKVIKDKFGRLDVLVCNVAANPYFGLSYEIGEKEFDKIFEVNVKNTFFTIKEALPLLKSARNSNILIISSQAGYTPFQYLGVYSMTKTVLLSMTKMLADELSKFNMRVNFIAPGIINTKFSKAIVDSDEAKSNFMKRAGIPSEISGAAAFLCSEEASFITGENLCITGGLHGRL